MRKVGEELAPEGKRVEEEVRCKTYTFTIELIL